MTDGFRCEDRPQREVRMALAVDPSKVEEVEEAKEVLKDAVRERLPPTPEPMWHVAFEILETAEEAKHRLEFGWCEHHHAILFVTGLQPAGRYIVGMPRSRAWHEGPVGS